MKRTLIALGLLLGAAPVALALTDCIPNGETREVHLALPPLGPGSGSGLPITAKWSGGLIGVWDADFLSKDDAVPGGTVHPNSISVPITSSGGKLFDKDGTIIDYGTEGSCIELYYERNFTFTASTSFCVNLALPGGGPSTKHCMETSISVKQTYRSPQTKICPC